MWELCELPARALRGLFSLISQRFQIDAAAFDHLAFSTVAESKQAPVLSISSATRGEYDTHPVAMVIHALPVSKRIST
ncbi:hypothetical protein [Burkholderia ubonensis]|uniref:Uncharacterized protein n=1 Tax=Burkholderia ubonensis TaxID=101571 RepID=A0AAW3NDN9_9BURK|nr:hypothetical protein [Burkholderia ubonensis]KVT54245.1 hypothetical protein WK53_05150 [Burkholderia ubonensis]KVZ76379.1 hypothetical protein WL22_08825 [Burkholderia ubonensis]KWE15852.1 hypothetical protein WL75_19975 [Burkholderia ubonensis]